MSDLEATRARAQAGAPITALASAKLRSFGGQAALFAETNTLANAFAEVFAQIVASSPKPVKPDAKPELCQCYGAEDIKSAETENDTASDSQSTGAEATADENVTPLVSDETPQIAADSNIGAAELTDSTDLESESLDVGHGNDQELTVAASGGSETESDDRVAKPIGEADDSSRQNRGQRGTPAVELAEPSRRRGQDGTVESEQNLGNDHQTDQGDDQTQPQVFEQEDSDSSRVQRRRYTHNKQAPDNVNATNSNQNGESRRGNVAGGMPAPEALADLSGPANQPSPVKPPSNSVEPLIATVNNVTSRVDRVNAPAGNQATMRGSSQPLEAANMRRTEPQAGTDAKPARQSAADTVSRVKLIQRVSKAFQHLGPEGGVVRLRLAPAEMGAVRVEMRINQRKVQARVVAETEAASNILREHLPDLRTRLESFGMQIERLEIETEANEQQHGSWFEDSQQEQRQGQQQSRRRFDRQRPIETGDVSPEISRAAVESGIHITCGVDVRF